MHIMRRNLPQSIYLLLLLALAASPGRLRAQVAVPPTYVLPQSAADTSKPESILKNRLFLTLLILLGISFIANIVLVATRAG